MIDKIYISNKNIYALVDEEDYEMLKEYKWHVNAKGYAEYCEHVSYIDGKQTVKSILMHRLIMNTPTSLHTDHINHDKLDNRKSNLRVCTRTENSRNRKAAYTNASGVAGVTWSKENQSWTARITVDGEKIFLGRYKDLKEAISVRTKASIKYHGEFAMFSNKGVI